MSDKITKLREKVKKLKTKIGKLEKKEKDNEIERSIKKLEKDKEIRRLEEKEEDREVCPYHKVKHEHPSEGHEGCIHHGHCLNPVQCFKFKYCPMHVGDKNMFLAWNVKV